MCRRVKNKAARQEENTIWNFTFRVLMLFLVFLCQLCPTVTKLDVDESRRIV